MESTLVVILVITFVALAIFANAVSDGFWAGALIVIGVALPVGIVADLLIGGTWLLGALAAPGIAFITFLAVRFDDSDITSW